MNVRKSKNFLEEFDKEKVKDGICKAYEATGEVCDDLILESIVNNLYLYDNIKTSEIRRQVEDALMSINKRVAKEYSRAYNETVPRRKKNDFIQEYIHAKNAATGSKFDSNANVTKKNIVTLGQELYKEENIKQNRYILFDKIRKNYSKKLAEQYIIDLESHRLYKHDESGTPGYPYCVAITMYPFLVNGLRGLGGESVAPTDLKSYCGEFINLVYSISSQFMGACMYKDQSIIIKDEDNVKNISAKLLVESNLNDAFKFENYQGEWEYSPVKNLKIFENGKFVNLNKVYRRKYNDDIFVIRTKSGHEARVSKDHIFKQLYKGRIFETKSKDLKVGDTVFMQKDFSSVINFDSFDYKKGWIIGLLCGDGSLKTENTISLSVNYNQEYIGDIFNEYSKEVYGFELNKNKGHRCFSYSKYNKEYYDLIHSDIIGSTTYDKHIDINDKSYDYLFGFLDGLFCADGSYSKNHGISISLSNRELAYNISNICKLVGIFTKVSMHNGKGNRKDYYTQYVPSRILKYLKNVHKKVLSKDGNEDYNFDELSREAYYYGSNAFNGKNGKCYLWSSSKKDEWLNTDVIESIEVFKNDDIYVYEVETETHWYNCGGFLTHNCATPEFLMYMDYFIRKDYGDDYINRIDEVVDLSRKKRTIGNVIDNAFQQVVHSMNMPAGNRGYQSVFWNVSYFDKPYFEGVFGDFEFPDGTKPCWETLSWLQKRFMKWFNNERLKYTFTFPVETMALLTDGNDDFLDKEYADFTAEMWSEGHSFFCYLSDSPDSLSSCCRLRNSLKDLDNDDTDHNHTTHQYSMGTASVATGSKSVMTMNLPRLVQDAARKYFDDEYGLTLEDGKNVLEMGLEYDKEELYEYIRNEVKELTERVHKYQTAFNDTIKDFLEANMLDVYRAGFIDMRKQYLTVGVNGITDAAEFLGIKVSNNEEYREFVNNILETINICNRKDRTRDCMFNTEFVPAENLAVKNYKWDKKDGYWVSPNRNLYSSYFYNPEDNSISILEKLKLHGKGFVDFLDGGSAYHCNLSEHLSKEQYRQFMKAAAKNGCNYFTFNVKNTVCNDCGYISKHTLTECPHCGSKNLDYLTRVIGYLKRVSSFSEARQNEEHVRYYA